MPHITPLTIYPSNFSRALNLAPDSELPGHCDLGSSGESYVPPPLSHSHTHFWEAIDAHEMSMKFLLYNKGACWYHYVNKPHMECLIIGQESNLPHGSQGSTYCVWNVACDNNVLSQHLHTSKDLSYTVILWCGKVNNILVYIFAPCQKFSVIIK